jgi:hypothetical protein
MKPIIFFIYFFIFQTIVMTDKKKSRSARFVKNVFYTRYGGPGDVHEFEATLKKKTIKFENAVKRCFIHVLNQPKLISHYDRFFCQGYGFHRSANTSDRMDYGSHCDNLIAEDAPEDHFAFCEGFREFTPDLII